VYEPEDVLPKSLKVVKDWKNGHVGDWVKTDDECIIQVLRRGQMLRSKGKSKIREYIGTCTGTFLIGPQVKMDTSKRTNIYSFGGNKSPYDILLDRTNLSKAEQVFVLYMSQGFKPQQAYLKAFPTKNIGYAKEKSVDLISTERIRTAMKEELKPVCKELGIDPKSVLKEIQIASKNSEKEDVRLRALFKLSDILDLEDKNQTRITQISGAIFKGFNKEVLEEVKRPEELENK
jgi:hypothetical protein